MVEPTKPAAASPLADPGRTQMGRSLVVKGDVIGNEDLTIFGQFEGSLSLQGHCVTVGPEGKVKGDIQASRVIIYGSVHGNVTVKERVEIYKTGHVVGDLVAPGISIEDGAYYKGKIEILRDGEKPEDRPQPSTSPRQFAAAAPRTASSMSSSGPGL